MSSSLHPTKTVNQKNEKGSETTVVVKEKKFLSTFDRKFATVLLTMALPSIVEVEQEIVLGRARREQLHPVTAMHGW